MSRQSSDQGSRRRRLGVPILGAALVAALVASAGAASTNFVEPASSPEQVGAGPQGVVVADLDGDGDRDLATANGSNSNVTVLRNNGAANFAPFASSPEGVGSFPTAITAADIDGDADQDLLVADQLDDAVYVLRNNGNANFTQPATSPEPAGDTPAEVAAADLDDDGDTDLAVADAIESTDTDNVTILLNNGNGNFARAPTSPEDAGNKPVAIATADLDGDGDADLATANQQSNTVTVLRNNGSANFNEAAGAPSSPAASRRTSSPPGSTPTPRSISRPSTRARARRTSRSCATAGTRTSPSRPRARSPWAGAR